MALFLWLLSHLWNASINVHDFYKRKKSIFQEQLRQSVTNPDLGSHAQVKGRQRSGFFGRDWLSGDIVWVRTTPVKPVFFGAVNEVLGLLRQLPNNEFHQTLLRHMNPFTFYTQNILKGIFKNLPPKHQNWSMSSMSNRHLTVTILQPTALQRCSFRLVVKEQAVSHI